MIRIGCDPGQTGGLAMILGDKVDLHKMPTRKLDNGKTEIDGIRLTRILEYYSLSRVNFNLELVHSMAKQGLSSTFSFGMGYGVIRGVLEAMGFNYNLVTPQKWKKYHKLIGTDKDSARLKAIELYPQCAEQLKFKNSSGMADALLIASY